jgi:PAS domain S-box-containing protein
MDRIRVRSLQWASGTFFTLLGTLLLIAPHQFDFVSHAYLHRYLYFWSVSFLAAGICLVAITLFTPARPRVVKAIHLVSAVLLLSLAVAFLRSGAWLLMVNYLVIGLGLLVSMFLPRAWHRDPRPVHADLFIALIGLTALLDGILLFLEGPAPDLTPIFGLSPAFRVGFGLAFSAAGLWLLAAETYKFQSPRLKRSNARAPAWVSLSSPWAKWAVSGIFLLFLLLATVPSSLWVAAIYFGVMAAILSLLSGIENYLEKFPPNSLRVRTAVVLSVSAAVPLVFMAFWNGIQEERYFRRETLSLQEREAMIIARDAEVHLDSHLPPLQALASQPGLRDLPPGEQLRELQIFAGAFPDYESFVIYDEAGSALASSDGRWMGTSLAGQPVYEKVQKGMEPDVSMIFSPVLERPVLRFSLPMLDGDGAFQGLVVSELATTTFTQDLRISDSGLLNQIYLIDEAGRVIVHPYSETLLAFRDEAAAPVIAALRENPAGSGSLTYRSGEEEYLTGYAGMPAFGWSVILIRPASDALASVFQSRDQAFGLLLFFLLLTCLVGLVIARWLTNPLIGLSQAIGGLTEGENTLPLPRTDFVEIQHLVAAFANLRVRLAARTAERERALANLRQARNELEKRVEERTVELLELNREMQAAKEKLEVELAEREELEKRLVYQALVLENVHDAVIATDEEFRITSWNLGAEFLYGWRVDEVLGKRVDEVLQDLQTGERAGTSFFVESGDSLGDVLHYRRDGRPVYVAGNTITLLKPEGGIGGYVATNADVTARKLAEKALQESERRLRTLLEHLPAGVWLADAEGKIVYGNPAAVKIWGGSRFVGMEEAPRMKAWWADSGEPVRPGEWASERAIRNGETRLNDVIEIESSDGARKVIVNSAVPILDQGQNVLGAVILNEDITVRRQAEINLAESEARERARAEELEALMDAVPAIVMVARDPECREITGNRFAYEVLRLSYGANQSLTPGRDGEPQNYRLYHEDREIQPEELPMQIAASTGVEVNDSRQKVVFEDGEYRYLLGNVAPLLDHQGRPRGAIGAFADITQIVETEQALHEYAARLERSNQDLEDFAFIASHDLQEPLRKIKSFSDLLQLNYGEVLGTEGCDFLNRMRDASDRMKEMIDDLLSYSRVASQPRAFSQVDLNQVACQVVADLEVSLLQSGGQVQIEDLPVIQADPVQMYQLLQNLLSNGLKFSRLGCPPLVRVSAATAQGRAPRGDPATETHSAIQLRVEDNGIGFEEKFTDRIFQPFQRLHGRSQYPGSGIGLAICRKIVEQHSGSIDAHSTPGQGSTFTVTLPQEPHKS